MESERPYPEGVAFDEAWRQRQRADLAEDRLDDARQRLTAAEVETARLRICCRNDGGLIGFANKQLVEIQAKLVAAEARLTADESELARLLAHTEQKLQAAEALLREAVEMMHDDGDGWDEDWAKRAKEVCDD